MCSMSVLGAADVADPGRDSAWLLRRPPNRLPDSVSHRGGQLVPPCPIDDHDEIVLEPPRLDPMTPAQNAEVVELFALLFATAARRRRTQTAGGLRRVA